MTDDLKAPERTFDHPYELSHSDGEWWTLKSNGFVVASFSLKTWGSAERIIEALPMVNRQRLREIANMTDMQIYEGVGE